MYKLTKFVWLIILLLITAIIGTLLFGGDIILYLAPRMMPMVFFGAAVFFALFINQLITMKQTSDSTFRIHHIIFLIPIVLFFSVMPNKDTLAELPNQNMNVSHGTQVSQIETPPAADTLTEQAPQPTVSKPPKNNGVTTQHTVDSSIEDYDTTPLPNETSAIQVPQDNESDDVQMAPCILQEQERDDNAEDMFEQYLYLSLYEMMGVEVTMYGFVFKDETFPENTIAVARRMMSCCAADTSLVGYHVKVEDADSFLVDQWIEVTGIVDVIELDMYDETYEFPIITDGTIVKCEAPPLEESYVYP